MVLCPAGEVMLELSRRPTRLAVTSPCLEHGERRGGERVETLTVEGFNLDNVIYNIWKRCLRVPSTSTLGSTKALPKTKDP